MIRILPAVAFALRASVALAAIAVTGVECFFLLRESWWLAAALFLVFLAMALRLALWVLPQSAQESPPVRPGRNRSSER